MASYKFTDECATRLTGLSTAEDLLAGLITHRGETGTVGQQLISILFNAGVISPGARKINTYSPLPESSISGLLH